jgi:hypothetical protein
MKQEVAVKKPAALTVPFVAGNLYANHKVEVQEIILPRCLLMQNTSKFVAQQTARPGEIVDTLTMEVVAKLKEPVEAIITDLVTKWTLSRMEGLQSVYVGQIPFDHSAPDNDIKEIMHNNILVQRDKTYEFMVITKTDLDSNKFLPFKIFSFSKSSRKTGHALASHFNTKIAEIMSGVNTAPFDRFFKISSELLYNDKKQPYYVLNQAAGDSLTEVQLKKAGDYVFRMMSAKSKGQVKVDDTEDEVVSNNKTSAPSVTDEF